MATTSSSASDPTAAPEPVPPLPLAHVLGYRLAQVTLEEAAVWCLAAARGEQPRLAVTLNPEIIVQARSDDALEVALQEADLSVADGVGVLWAARRSGVRLPGRVPGVELVTRVLELGGPDLRVYYLGAALGVAERAAQAAATRFGTVTAGVQHGYFRRPEDVPEVVRAVRESGAQLLLAGLGEGQERFLHEHRQALCVPLAIGVGGTLDVLSGTVARTPPWTRRLGLEWAYRVGLDRKRWHRFPRLLRFIALVLRR